MKIYIGGSTFNFAERKKDFFKIRDYLVNEGHVIVHDWLNKYRDPDKDPSKAILPKSEYDNVLKAISKSDVVIFENTHSGFSNGYLISHALQEKKATMVLWKEGSSWDKRPGFISGLESTLLELQSYNKKNLFEVVNGFLNKYGNANLRHRFNLVINDTERQYLEWLNYESFKSRTSIIRDLIQKDMDKNEKYKRFLEKGIN